MSLRDRSVSAPTRSPRDLDAQRRHRRRWLPVVVLALALSGCVPAPSGTGAAADGAARGGGTGVPPAAGGGPPATEALPSTVPVNIDTPQVRASTPERMARRATVRVRSLGCGRIGTASAVAVGRRLLVTNRHVVAGADRVELNFWDGTRATARPATVAVADDLALVRVSRDLPAVAHVAADDAAKGSEVFVVGFPNGGRQSIARGELIEYAPLERRPDASHVMRLSAAIAPGNSGGPVLDRSGDVVGVVFGIETATGDGLAIPASAVRQLLERRGAGDDVPGCP